MSALSDLLDKVVDVAVVVITTDSEAGKINTVNVVQTEVPCRIEEGGSNKGTQFGQFALTNDATIYFDGLLQVTEQTAFVFRRRYNHGPKDRYFHVVGVKVTDEEDVYTTVWVAEFDPFLPC